MGWRVVAKPLERAPHSRVHRTTYTHTPSYELYPILWLSRLFDPLTLPDLLVSFSHRVPPFHIQIYIHCLNPPNGDVCVRALPSPLRQNERLSQRFRFFFVISSFSTLAPIPFARPKGPPPAASSTIGTHHRSRGCEESSANFLSPRRHPQGNI